MAKTPEAALALMMRLWRAATERVRTEVADRQALADSENATENAAENAADRTADHRRRAAPAAAAGAPKIAPWDCRHQAEKVGNAQCDIDEEQIKPYLPLDKMREAMFWAAGQVFGLAFKRLAGVPVCHASVTAHQVQRAGRRIGRWFF